MNRVHSKTGEGPYGLPLMKFTLLYQGELRANDRPKGKWAIRKQFHPQLEELWRVHPSLQTLSRLRYVPLVGHYPIEGHHSADKAFAKSSSSDSDHQMSARDDIVDLCECTIVGNRSFIPLVRDSLALQCGLKVTFLRKEEPGRLYQGGDLDNRLKTLFDALSVPNQDQIVTDSELSEPVYCLLENDRLIASLSVDTHRLLSSPEASKHEVHLMIEVDVRVTQPRLYNQVFLGD
jgi:hypothetical protein